jgi:L-lactate dehydrogenase (cytochrome)
VTPQSPFETVAQAQRCAQKRVPAAIYSNLISGFEQLLTANGNVAAFDELGFVPRVGLIPTIAGMREQETSVVGQRISLPVLISPTGAQGIHPGGELAAARAAARAGTAFGLSSFAGIPVEAAVQANPQTFFQLYWVGSRDRVRAVLERARDAGAKALIFTVDRVFAHRRDRPQSLTPMSLPRVDFLTMARHYGPQAIQRPRWLLDFLRAGGMPKFMAPNLGLPGQPPPTFFAAYVDWAKTPLPTVADWAWVREQWPGPLVIKGITHPDDARRAVEIGADGISVSNHGGNNLDGTLATIRLLPAIVDAVGDQIEVLLDGGVRRGSDVVKALALGARAVLIGRAYLWGLAAAGEAGVYQVLQILRAGIDETLIGLGRESVHDVIADDIVVPSDFSARALPLRAPTSGDPWT